jgi:hypothetical protein
VKEGPGFSHDEPLATRPSGKTIVIILAVIVAAFLVPGVAVLIA